MTTQANHKRNMRESEEEVINAEKWASLAWLDGREYPGKELTEDWKKVLFNQFHDLAAGSGIGQIYRDAQKDYDVVRWSTNEIDANALETVAERINTSGGGIPVLVYNPLGWERSGDVTVRLQFPKASPENVVVTDTEARKIVFESGEPLLHDVNGLAQITLHVDNVPALGYKLLSATQEKTANSLLLLAQNSRDSRGS